MEPSEQEPYRWLLYAVPHIAVKMGGGRYGQIVELKQMQIGIYLKKMICYTHRNVFRKWFSFSFCLTQLRLPTVKLLKRALKRRSRKTPQHSTARCRAFAAEHLAQQFPDAQRWQIEIMTSVDGLTMTSPERIFALIEAVTYVCKHDIPGDFVECGVWKGGSSAAIARTLNYLGKSDRILWMYDTFEGMSSPTDSDVDFNGQTAVRLLNEQDIAQPASIWCRSPLDEVKQTMLDTGYRQQNIRFVAGKVEDTLSQSAPENIALLRLDTDWYESTRYELEVLFPLLSDGGVLIVDDYGHWQGCRKAVDEYFIENKIRMMLNRIDYTGRIGIFQARGQVHG